MEQKLDCIEQRLSIIRQRVSESAKKACRDVDDITIMAVTKTISPEAVNVAIENGITLLGENRVQEYLDKADKYQLSKKNIHFIGHLQTNKVKYIIDKVSMIESVSSIKLAEEIHSRASAQKIIMPILLEVNISEEETKSGFFINEINQALERIFSLQNVSVQGLMCIPAKTKAEYYFEKMNSLFQEIKQVSFPNGSMKYLSMGMSGDYEEAIVHGANIIRLGSAIFGERKIGG